MHYVIRKPTQYDIEFLIDNVRNEDIEEVDAISGMTIREVLSETENLTENSEVWVVDGKVVCIFGVTPVEEHKGFGLIWLLATDEFEKYTKTFVSDCRKILERLVHNYDVVYNYAHSKNEKSIEWLRWLGFKICEPEPIGHNGEMFTRFEMKKCAIQ